MKANPSTYTHDSWSTRPSIQDRLTIIANDGSTDRKPILTIIHADRVSPNHLQLILAAPRLLHALTLLRREASFAHEISDRLSDALCEADAALEAACLAQL